MDDLQTNPIGVYGWRKRCLYFFVLLLVVMVVVNLGLTIWILIVLDFNIHGMGGLRIMDSGLRLSEGRAEFNGPLYALSIAADQDGFLTMQSDSSVDINTGSSQLNIEPDSINILADSFEVHSQDQSGDQPLFSVSRDGVSVATSVLDARGPLGASFDGPVEASQITPLSDGNLRLEAPSGQVWITGAEETTVHAQEGGLAISTYGDIVFSSRNITMDISSMSFQDIPISAPTDPNNGKLWDGVRELCICGTGEVYAVEVSSSGIDGCYYEDRLCGELDRLD